MQVTEGEAAVTTSLSVHELFSGASGKKELVIRGLLGGIEVLPFTQKDAEISGKISNKLAKQGKMINKIDILIAGICLSKNATLVTLDNDFKKIPELKIAGI